MEVYAIIGRDAKVGKIFFIDDFDAEKVVKKHLITILLAHSSGMVIFVVFFFHSDNEHNMKKLIEWC